MRQDNLRYHVDGLTICCVIASWFLLNRHAHLIGNAVLCTPFLSFFILFSLYHPPYICNVPQSQYAQSLWNSFQYDPVSKKASLQAKHTYPYLESSSLTPSLPVPIAGRRSGMQPTMSNRTQTTRGITFGGATSNSRASGAPRGTRRRSSSPGPGAYSIGSGMGRQTTSRYKSGPAPSFRAR